MSARALWRMGESPPSQLAGWLLGDHHAASCLRCAGAGCLSWADVDGEARRGEAKRNTRHRGRIHDACERHLIIAGRRER